MNRLAVVSWVATMAAALCSAPVASAQSSCQECHRDLRNPVLRAPVTLLKESIHGKQNLRCNDCHGGNPDEPSVRAMDPKTGFKSRIEAASMPETCGTCHADRNRFMKAGFKIPTDQLTGYRLSVHGKAFARGNTRAAACWDCHGHHLVLPPDDPRSKVYPGNIAETCGACHSNAEVMAGTGLPTNQVREWHHSVHGRAFAKWVAAGGPLKKSHKEHPPTCNDCHGEHRIAEPETAFHACTGCHADAWKAFRASPHRKAFERMGFVPCVACHGSHNIQPVDATLIGLDRSAACRRCHRDGQRMATKIRAWAKSETQAETLASRASRLLRKQAKDPEARALLAKVQGREYDLRIAIHTLSEKRIKRATRALSKVADTALARSPSRAKKNVRRERLRIVFIGGSLALIVALIALGFGWRRKP